MFPLRQRKLIRGCQAHINAGLGCGADYHAHYVYLYAPKSGRLTGYWGYQGGNWARLTLENGDVIEMAHLDRLLKSGTVKEGELIGITGNTGNVTDFAHLHIQIFRGGKRLDPETYQWGSFPETLDTIRAGINQNFRNQFKREPEKDDNDYFLSRIGQPLPVGINTLADLIEKMRFWSRQTNAQWIEERKKVLNK